MKRTPTDKEIKEFWGRCGFNWWETAEAWCFGGDEVSRELPPIDLNNLFNYAVPKLHKEDDWLYSIKYTYNYPNGGVTCEITTEKYLYMGHGEDSPLALFWAIYEVIK